jgi:hypothetical protein
MRKRTPQKRSRKTTRKSKPRKGKGRRKQKGGGLGQLSVGTQVKFNIIKPIIIDDKTTLQPSPTVITGTTTSELTQNEGTTSVSIAFNYETVDYTVNFQFKEDSTTEDPNYNLINITEPTDVPEAAAEIATGPAEQSSSIQRPEKNFFGIVTDNNRNAFIQSLKVGDKITFKRIKGKKFFSTMTDFTFTDLHHDPPDSYRNDRSYDSECTGIITKITQDNDMKLFPESGYFNNLDSLPPRTNITFCSKDFYYERLKEFRVCFCNDNDKNAYDIKYSYGNWKEYINPISIISKEPATQEEQQIVTDFKAGDEERIIQETKAQEAQEQKSLESRSQVRSKPSSGFGGLGF